MVGLLHAMAFMVLLLIGWVIWNNKPLPLPSDVQEHWLMHWGWLKSDQTCTQANMLAVFPLTTAWDRRCWSHCHALGLPEMSTSFFSRQLSVSGFQNLLKKYCSLHQKFSHKRVVSISQAETTMLRAQMRTTRPGSLYQLLVPWMQCYTGWPKKMCTHENFNCNFD